MEIGRIIALIVLILIIVAAVNLIRPASSLPDLISKFGFQAIGTWQYPGTGQSGDSSTSGQNGISATYAYQLVDTTSNSRAPYGQVFYNAKLVRVYGSGKTEDVIPNIRNRFSNILSQPNQMLTTYYFPPNSDILYFSFRNYYVTGTASQYHIYRYNVKTDEMKDLFVNRYLTSFAVQSPYSQLMLLSVDDDTMRTYQRLYLVNLENDSARMLAQLGSNETLASTLTPSGQNPSADIFWVAPNQIGYNVYQRVNQNGTDSIVFKERRQLPI